MTNCRRRGLIAALGLLSGRAAWAGVTVTVYTNVDFPPFVIDPDTGIYPELVAWLNRRRPGGLQFRLARLPRVRLQQAVERGELDGIVIGMMPAWFDDLEERKYLWTAPFYDDGFMLVSPRERPVHREHPGLQGGTRIGTTFGYVYPGLAAWLERHRLQRDDAPSEAVNLEKLLKGRFAAAVLTASVFRHAQRQRKIDDLVAEPLNEVRSQRRFLVPRSQARVHEAIAPLLQAIGSDPQWQAVLARYPSVP